jgi:hypothetical protein
MKNINQLKTNEICLLCGNLGFFCESSMGRCGSSCPCCGQRHFLDWGYSKEYCKTMNMKYTDKKDMRLRYLYCEGCGIIFELGCIHWTTINLNTYDDVNNAHLIKKWINIETGIDYEGMPYFSNKDDWFANVNKVKVLEIYCPNKNIQCTKTRITKECFIK